MIPTYLFLNVRALLQFNRDIVNTTCVLSKRNSNSVTTFSDKWQHWKHGPYMDMFTKTNNRRDWN